MFEILEKLVWFHTTADDEQSIFEALDYVSGYLIDRGMHVNRFESNGHESIVATVNPDTKTPKVMLAAHIDVVPAPDEMFAVRKEDGKLYGRGVLDMKFAIAAYMQLADELQNHLQDYDFGIMITSDEELAGMNGVPKLLVIAVHLLDHLLRAADQSRAALDEVL
jgi:succinyl-diaminopimelate desuccinylase